VHVKAVPFTVPPEYEAPVIAPDAPNVVHDTEPPDIEPLKVPDILPDEVISFTETILPVPNVKFPLDDVFNDVPVIVPPLIIPVVCIVPPPVTFNDVPVNPPAEAVILPLDKVIAVLNVGLDKGAYVEDAEAVVKYELNDAIVAYVDAAAAVVKYELNEAIVAYVDDAFDIVKYVDDAETNVKYVADAVAIVKYELNDAIVAYVVDAVTCVKYVAAAVAIVKYELNEAIVAYVEAAKDDVKYPIIEPEIIVKFPLIWVGFAKYINDPYKLVCVFVDDPNDNCPLVAFVPILIFPDRDELVPIFNIPVVWSVAKFKILVLEVDCIDVVIGLP
jgi:hypothetical protein